VTSVSVVHEGAVAILTLARPESRNALSDEFLAELVDAVYAAERAAEVGCVVVAGHEDYFSVGADIHELAARAPEEVLRGPRERLWSDLRAARIPLVAAVSGHCLGGGCELALSCDLIVASETARFGQPETRLGLIPGGGGTQLLARAVGPAVAADMVLSGRILDAPGAGLAGLVARVVAPELWLETAVEVATTIAARPPLGVTLAKQALGLAREAPFGVGAAFERALYNHALADADTREQLAAFAARRHER
jgi:enoyl-CoA hydratase